MTDYLSKIKKFGGGEEMLSVTTTKSFKCISFSVGLTLHPAQVGQGQTGETESFSSCTASPGLLPPDPYHLTKIYFMLMGH